MAKIRGSTQILAGSITNAEIGAAAAIAWSKISPTWGTPGSIAPDDTAAEGSGTDAARSDHTHGILAAAAGALGGTAGSEGSATTFARADHGHLAFDATDPVTLSFGDSAAPGSATVAARRDHAHGMPPDTAVGSYDVTRETLGGTINGTNTAFTLATAPSPVGSEIVFLNGVMLDAVGTPSDMSQYSISGVDVTIGVAPISGDSLKSCYGT